MTVEPHYGTGSGQKWMMYRNSGADIRMAFVELAFFPADGAEPLTTAELRRLIDHRPLLWGRFSAYMHTGLPGDDACAS